jgi:hypothetical protein
MCFFFLFTVFFQFLYNHFLLAEGEHEATSELLTIIFLSQTMDFDTSAVNRSAYEFTKFLRDEKILRSGYG